MPVWVCHVISDDSTWLTLRTDLFNGSIASMTELGVTESFKLKKQVLLSASEASESILRVDHVLRSTPRKRFVWSVAVLHGADPSIAGKGDRCNRMLMTSKTMTWPSRSLVFPDVFSLIPVQNCLQLVLAIGHAESKSVNIMREQHIGIH